ncbi:MAG: type II toxin-antitoxin system VapC family toxin [Burkholderiales bacterium]|nr:type II toxin-antitoxin system VapC family toxin [Opitutaceae bacterium]
MIYLPDTNVFSRFFQGRDPDLARRFIAEYPHLRLSVLVLGELEFGAAKSGIARHRARVERLTTDLEVAPWTPEDARHYGRIRAELERTGQKIGTFDTLIAAQALRLGATVVTHNLREFRRVPGLRVEDWQSTA